MAKKLTKTKARQILHDKEVHGQPLTEKQRKFFGAIAGGAKPYKAQNGIEGTMGGLTDIGFNFNPAWGGAWRDGGMLQPPMAGANQTVPMAQFGLTYLEPNSYKFPRVTTLGPLYETSSEKAASIGGENGEPAYLIPTMKYGRMQVDPVFEFKRTGEHLGGPFKTWQEAEAWERDVRHPYVEKGQSIPTPYRRWGQFAMGGNLPGSVGFMYARTQGAAPSEGPYAKKTLPSAQNGMEMKYYQEGLDFKPKTISRNGGWLDKYDVPEAQVGIELPGYAKQYLSGRQGDMASYYPDIKRVKEQLKMAQENSLEKVKERVAQKRSRIYDQLRRAPGLKLYSDQELQQYAQQSKDKWPKWVRQMFDDESNIVYNVVNHPDYNPSVPVSSQRELADDNSLRTMILRGRNKLLNSGNPVVDFANSIITAPGSAVANIMFDSQNAYNNPNLPVWQNLLNTTLDVANILPLVGPTSRGVGTVTKNLWSSGIRNIPRQIITGVDKRVSPVGRQLYKIEQEGKAAGLSDWEIKNKQLETVGITSNQRKGYIPGVSELAYKYIRPYNYGDVAQSKFSEILENIRKGGVDYTKVLPQRSDAWRLYLGLPQKNKTFMMSTTSPIRHQSYAPGTLTNMDIYSFNPEIEQLEAFGPAGLRPISEVKPNIPSGGEAIMGPRQLQREIEILENPIIIDKQHSVMGGYNKRLNQYGLEYNDVWDLNPTLAGVKIPVSSFIGKPFMSHGVIPYTSKQHTQALRNMLAFDIQAMSQNPQAFGPTIDKYRQVLENLKNYPKRKEGGEVVKDNMGYWNPENWGKVVEIDSPYITMEGVDVPLIGVSDTGDVQYMEPGEDYVFDGESVTEYPVAQKGKKIQAIDVKDMKAKRAHPQYPVDDPRSVGLFFNRYKKPEDKRDTLYVSDPNDPRLRAYNDSLNLYKAMQMQDRLMGPGNKPVKPTIKWTTEDLKQGRSKKIRKGLESYGPMAEDFQSEKEQFEEGFNPLTARKEDKKLLDYYKSLGFKPDQIMYHSSPDIVSDKIRAIGSYFDGTAQSPIYKKPVQPVEYRKPEPKQEVVKKPEPVVEKKAPLTDYFQGTPIYAPTPYHGSGAGAFVGYRTPQGDTVFVKPEDYERMAVPKYGREFIESHTKKQRNGGVSVNNADAQPLKKLDDLFNFTNYNKPKAKNGWLEKYK